MEKDTAATFSFTQEQESDLQKWKGYLYSQQAQEWDQDEKEALDTVKNIFEEVGFEKGKDINPELFDEIFRQMRRLIWNRSLTSNLYEENGLSNFNSKLRKLLFSPEPLATRVDQFLKLHYVGILTVSQFLCAYSPTEYPELSSQTVSVLGLDSTQMDTAFRQALDEHNITNIQSYRSDTLQYLRDSVIFREIRNLLNIETYTRVNNMLWLVLTQESPEELPTPISSVSLEKDLQEYLAKNPGLVEKGLKLVEGGKNYHIKGAGNIDVLCRDKSGAYVVIETKKNRASDEVVGQILRYIGALKKEHKKVRGIIIVNEPDERLDFALEAVKDFVKLKYYKVEFQIKDTYES